VAPVEEGEDEIFVPMYGYLWPVAIVLREENGFASGEDGSPLAVGMCSFSIAICETAVYMPRPQDQPANARDALICIAYLVDRFLTHPVRWWEASSWEGRPVRYRGTLASITDYVVLGGLVRLDVEDMGEVWTRWDANDVEWAPATVDMGETESQE